MPTKETTKHKKDQYEDFNDPRIDTSRPLYFPTPAHEDMMRDLRDKQLIAGIEGADD